MDAYNYYMNGWIDKATVFKLPYCPNSYLAISCVKRSQSLSATPAKHWVAVKTEEIVVSVHCTCMAVLGKHQKNLSCTSLLYFWLPLSFHNVSFSQLADIDFVTPQVKREKIDMI